MADFLDQDESLDEVLSSEDTTKPSNLTETQEEVPEKYRGKALKDIIKMHQEAESTIGRQGQEVALARQMTEQALALKQKFEGTGQQTAPKSDEIKEVEDDLDFFVDPKKAVAKAVENHPAIKAAREDLNRNKADRTQAKLKEVHPDVDSVVADPEFINWLKQSPSRLRLLQAASQDADFDSANELVSNFKMTRALKQKETTQAAEELKASQGRAVQAATVNSGNNSGEATGKKVYRRIDIQRLMHSDPDRYNALQDEILQAYAEGRVK